MEFKCKYCKKNFTSLGNLTKHQKTTKYCLKIQNENKLINNDVTTHKCDYCKKDISKYHLKKHTQNCVLKYQHIIDYVEKKYQNSVIELKENIAKTNNENLKLKERTIELETEVRILRERDERSMSTVEEIAKQPRINTTTNTQNKIIITTPLDLSKENLLSVIESGFDNNYLVQGQKGVARFAYEKILKDDEGKLKYICTDPSRQVFQYKNEDGKIQKDVRATKLTKALFDAELKKTSHKIAWDVMKDDDDEVFSEFNDHYQSIRSMEQNNCEFSKELSCLAV